MVAVTPDSRIERSWDSVLRIIALAVILSYPLAHLILAPPHLFADGTDFFLGLLNQKGFHIWDKPRMFAQILTQFPVVVALQSGVRSVTTLGFIFSGTLLLVPGLLWLAAAALHVRTRFFWHVAIAYSIVFVPGSLFAIGEYNVCYAINALVLSLLLLNPFRWPQAFLVALLSMINVLTYPSNVLLAPVLIALLVRKLRSPWRERPPESLRMLLKICLSIAIVAYGSAFLISLWVNLFPRDPSMAAAARDPDNLRLYIGLLIGAVLAGWIPLIGGKAESLLWKLSAGIYLLLLPLLLRELIASPEHAYEFRTPFSLGLLLCLVVQPMLMLRRSPRFSVDRTVLQSGFCCLLVLMLSTTGLIRAYNFQQWLHAYRQELDIIEKDVPIDKTRLPDSPYSQFNWGWNNFQLSRILNPINGKLILNASDLKGWQPDRSALPMLCRQGFRP